MPAAEPAHCHQWEAGLSVEWHVSVDGWWVDESLGPSHTSPGDSRAVRRAKHPTEISEIPIQYYYSVQFYRMALSVLIAITDKTIIQWYEEHPPYLETKLIVIFAESLALAT